MTEAVTAAARKVTKVAVLDSSVRLVVLQFMVANERVPQGFPSKPPAKNPPVSPIPGEKVLQSTPDVNLAPFVSGVDIGADYELVHAWKHPHVTNWKMTVLRFVYCRKQYVKRDELCSDFVARFDYLETELVSLVFPNLWAVEAYLNPYCESDGSRTDTNVLILGCVGRKPNVEVFRDGRDPATNRGVGPKVLLSTIASKLKLVDDEVQLELRS